MPAATTLRWFHWDSAEAIREHRAARWRRRSTRLILTGSGGRRSGTGVLRTRPRRCDQHPNLRVERKVYEQVAIACLHDGRRVCRLRKEEAPAPAPAPAAAPAPAPAPAPASAPALTLRSSLTAAPAAAGLRRARLPLPAPLPLRARLRRRVRREPPWALGKDADKAAARSNGVP